MYNIKFDDYLKAINEASKIFGADPAYFGDEGDEEVERQLMKMGYTENDLKEARGN